MPRKIKVLDIIPESNENTPINDDAEVIKEPEPDIETEVKSEEKVEEAITEPTQEKQEEIQQTPTEIVDETTKTRQQELRQCPKCMKWLTPKTLKYFHMCTKDDTVKAKRRPKKVIAVKDIEDLPDNVMISKTTTIISPGYQETKNPKLPKYQYN